MYFVLRTSYEYMRSTEYGSRVQLQCMQDGATIARFGQDFSGSPNIPALLGIPKAWPSCCRAPLSVVWGEAELVNIPAPDVTVALSLPPPYLHPPRLLRPSSQRPPNSVSSLSPNCPCSQGRIGDLAEGGTSTFARMQTNRLSVCCGYLYCYVTSLPQSWPPSLACHASKYRYLLNVSREE